ncbi:ABC transporter ATP-binding protein [Haloarcula sp. CBA1127]|uniref:ABC transporter ATP-binding protein n=1 Tax=Haloarcula sp. CBA1127 TaxID=1765055 RepID=UPI00073E8F40|nr:ABC transporter ATP-binding protein [Haloarcula sp. CBA1127]
MNNEASQREKLAALEHVARHRPLTTLAILGMSLVAAVLEGIGLSFILPIIEVTRGQTSSSDQSQFVEAFVTLYDVLGIPFSLEYIIVGVITVMGVRYGSSFVVDWLKAYLRTDYVRHLQTTAFNRALDTEIAYFDEKGSDDILNTIVTQAEYAGQMIQWLVEILKQAFMSLIYVAIVVYLAPKFLIVAAVFLGGLFYFARKMVESGYSVGDRVADANHEIQTVVQAGTQGIRDVKLFALSDELMDDFLESVQKYTDSTIQLYRNRSAIDHFYQFTIAVTIFASLYAFLEYSTLSFGGLGLLLFAVFRLAPRVSTINNQFYQIEGHLPHLIRTQTFVDELADRKEPGSDGDPCPDQLESVSFRDVTFAYQDETVLDDISFAIEQGEFVAFAGGSGAGKSTIVSLLARFYDPDTGTITANDVPIETYKLDEWRQRLSVVRQQPYIFNDTLWKNVTVADRDATKEEVEAACRAAQVTEFLDELPNGFDTVLGDDGVRLSGGQRQRISIARAVLKDAEILVLDEATSDLDSHLEEEIHERIERRDDVMLVVIAHRLSTITDADRIYVVDDGGVREVGPHDELLEQDGMYASMYRTQIRSP